MSWGEVIWQNNLIKTNAQIFTSNGTFIVPNNVKTIYITACAGGGGGGGYSTDLGSRADYYGGEGGYGGDYVIRKPYNVTPKQSISITIGKGGNGGSLGNAGSNGRSTIISDLITLVGGNGGISGSNSYKPLSKTNGGAGGEGGACHEVSSSNYNTYPPTNGESLFASGAFTIQGHIVPGYGGKAIPVSVKKGSFGGGGGASLGNGGSEYREEVSSFVRISPGYGGGGLGGSDEITSGQAGGDGICIIEWGLNI